VSNVRHAQHENRNTIHVRKRKPQVSEIETL